MYYPIDEWRRLSLPKLQSTLSFKAARGRWWWINSKEDFQTFAESAFAQGYEVLRRLNPIRNEAFLSGNKKTTWIKLHPARRQYFKCVYKNVLERMGIVKLIFFSPREIIFDCRLSNYYLIEALKHQLAYPTPPAAVPRYSFPPSSFKMAENEFHDYVKGLKWKACRDPRIISLILPFNEVTRKAILTESQVLSCFTTWIKKLPPASFVKHRSKFEPLIPRRPPYNKAATLAYALMVLDFPNCPQLAKQLGSGRLKEFFLPQLSTQQGQVPAAPKVLKTLVNARGWLEKLVPEPPPTPV